MIYFLQMYVSASDEFAIWSVFFGGGGIKFGNEKWEFCEVNILLVEINTYFKYIHFGLQLYLKYTSFKLDVQYHRCLILNGKWNFCLASLTN